MDTAAYPDTEGINKSYTVCVCKGERITERISDNNRNALKLHTTHVRKQWTDMKQIISK